MAHRFTSVGLLAILLLAPGVRFVHAAEVITISPIAPNETQVVRVAVDSFIDCGQQALPPQRTGNLFVVQIVFDPSVINCNIATLHFAFNIGPLSPGAYRVRTIRTSNGVPGLVTDFDFAVSAVIPALSMPALISLAVVFCAMAFWNIRRRHTNDAEP